MTRIFLFLVPLFALTYPCRAQMDGPDFTHCQSNSECAPNHCCVLGPIRYSIPQCKPMQEEGEVCRPASVETLNITLGYPDGTQLTLHDAHYILCPCADGLSCDLKEGVCKEISEKRDTNRLFGEHRKGDD